MIPTKCPNCGAPVNQARGICEYCGTKFAHDDLRIIYSKPLCDTISTSISVDMEFFDCFGGDLQEANERAVREISRALADNLAPYLTIRSREDPMTRSVIMRGDLRVLRPDARF